MALWTLGFWSPWERSRSPSPAPPRSPCAAHRAGNPGAGTGKRGRGLGSGGRVRPSATARRPGRPPVSLPLVRVPAPASRPGRRQRAVDGRAAAGTAAACGSCSWRCCGGTPATPSRPSASGRCGRWPSIRGVSVGHSVGPPGRPDRAPKRTGGRAGACAGAVKRRPGARLAGTRGDGGRGRAGPSPRPGPRALPGCSSPHAPPLAAGVVGVGDTPLRNRHEGRAAGRRRCRGCRAALHAHLPCLCSLMLSVHWSAPGVGTQQGEARSGVRDAYIAVGQKAVETRGCVR